MCPFLDKSNPRCAAHLTLSNILGAFSHCADRYGECPEFKYVKAQVADDDRRRVPAVLLAAS